MINVVIGIIIIAAIILALKKTVKDAKNGTCAGCSGCSGGSCEPGACSAASVRELEVLAEKIRTEKADSMN